MKNIKKFFKFVYETYIQDNTPLTKTGKILLYVPSMIRAGIIYSLSVLFFPLVLIHMDIKKIIDDIDLIKQKL